MFNLKRVITTSIGLFLCLVWCQMPIVLFISPYTLPCLSCSHNADHLLCAAILILIFSSSSSIGKLSMTSTSVWAAFAALSAASFPAISQWLGIHCRDMSQP